MLTYATPGFYPIRTQADTLNSVVEAKEGNNVKGTVKVTVY